MSTSEKVPVARSPIKFPGGKSWIVPRLWQLTAHYERYYEPFCGSAVAGINMYVPVRIIGDRNCDIVEMLRWIQQHPRDFVDELERTWQDVPNTREGYEMMRRRYNALLECGCFRTINDAAMFVWLNRHGFNGVVRYNQQGFYNVPFGHYENPRYSESVIMETHAMLLGKDTQLRCGSYDEICYDAGKECVIYCDPPYLDEKAFTSYHKQKWDAAEHIKLHRWIIDKMDLGARVILSGAGNQQTREIYSQGAKQIIEDEARRNVSSKASTRGMAKELIFVY